MNFHELIVATSRAERYMVAGAVCSLSTNSEALCEAMGKCFARVTEPVSKPDVSMLFSVDDVCRNVPLWPKPYFRGLSHLVFAAFGPESELLIDLRDRRIIGRFSPTIVSDQAYLARVVFPAIFGIVSQTARIAGLHCASVVTNGKSVLLAGDSGSGKSTLSLALAQLGLALLSDDWTYLSRQGTRLRGWSLNNSLKLLPDAAEHFPELAQIEPIISLNGELAYELEPDRIFGIRCCACAEPRCLIFLEREGKQKLNLTEMPSVEAAARLEQSLEELPAALCEARDFVVKTIRILAQLPCWRLRYGAEGPHKVARSILDFLNENANA